MIQFETQVVQNYSKMIQSLLNSEDLYSENCFMNFDKGTIEFKSGITKEGQEIFGSIKVPFVGDHKNFWVDTALLIHLCNNYNVLAIENKVFRNNDLVFELKNMDESGNNETVFGDFSWDNSKPIQMASITSLVEASQFTGERFPHVAVGNIGEKTIVAGSDGVSYYENVVDNDFSIQFSKTMVKLLADAGSKEIRYANTDDQIYFNINQDVELITNVIKGDSVPCTDSNFRGLLSGAKPVVEFDKSQMQNVIRFLKPFFAKSPKQVYSITLLENMIEIKPDVADNKATQKIECKFIDPKAVGKKFGIMSLYLEKILRGITTDSVVLKTTEETYPNFGIFTKLDSKDESYMVKFIRMEA